MANYEGKTLVDCTVVTDGSSFLGATFERVNLMYRGGDIPNFGLTHFVEARFGFEDAAARTLLMFAYIEMFAPEQMTALLDAAREKARKEFKRPRAN